jgi:hypothetical protein
MVSSEEPFFLTIPNWCICRIVGFKVSPRAVKEYATQTLTKAEGRGQEAVFVTETHTPLQKLFAF